MIDTPYYNCISLGWFCGTAASMNKYGLRGFSGPFDWFISDLPSVMKQIDDGFTDFMTKENIEPETEGVRTFTDRKYGFRCLHDVKINFNREYQEIKFRYDRRASRFLEAIEEPSVLLRAVINDKEVEYINNNSEYIRNVVTKYNKANEIVFLLPDNVTGMIHVFRSFRLGKKYEYDSYSLRTLFDSSKELREFTKGILPKDMVLRNLEFDRADNSSVAAEVYEMMEAGDLRVAEGILNKLDAAKEDGIFIWGAGHHGTALFNYLNKTGVKINAVVDINAMTLPQNEIPLILPSEVPDNGKIFIAIASMKYCDEVMERLANKNCKAVTYKDLREELGLC